MLSVLGKGPCRSLRVVLEITPLIGNHRLIGEQDQVVVDDDAYRQTQALGKRRLDVEAAPGHFIGEFHDTAHPSAFSQINSAALDRDPTHEQDPAAFADYCPMC
ncbi:MAG: hypothetical protein ABT00_08695 [Bordetella sp. SCN 68-11]|nr:MAG: hypothetical protein ABT00_08695 [Bordetella sp. SCN 68-11]HAS1004590.1 hypothetical protein [Enterobacter cloacae]